MNGIERKDKKKLLFYICGVSLPVLQFVIFYLVINFNAIIMAFQDYDVESGNFFFSLNNFSVNFSSIWNDVIHNASGKNLGVLFLNSFKYYVFSVIFASGLNILFANYIYKKNIGHKFFQIMLFLPKILSATVLFIVFKYMLENGVPELMDKVFGKEIHSLIGGSVSNSAKFNWYMIFSIWSGFGTGVLVYTSTMSGIPQEVVESAQLDGITPLKELTHITMPMIYPTFTTFMVVNFATIFTNEMSLFLFEGYIGLGQVDATNSSRFTIGYYLFGGAQSAQSHHEFKTFTYLSTFGLILSMIAIPTTFIFKRLLEKCGPSFE